MAREAVWFRKDARLNDNPAQPGRKPKGVSPLSVIDPALSDVRQVALNACGCAEAQAT